MKRQGAAAAIPLDLTALVASLEEDGDYSLRVEKLPERGRLSSGRNNGDRTWSLKPNDLDGLTYLPPDGMTKPHTLAVRVVRLKDDAATTVALHDFPVTPKGAPKDDAFARATLSDAVTSGDDADDGGDDDTADYAQTLSDQMAAARKASVSEFDALLVKKGAGAIAKPTESENVLRLEQTLQAAQAESEAALAAATARYESAEAAADELRKRVEGLQEAETALAGARDELAALQARHKAQDAELAEARRAVEQARRDGAKSASEAALKKAQAAFEDELKKRLAARDAEAARQLEQARKEWRKASEAELADATAGRKAAEAEAEDLRFRVEALQENEAALDRARNDISELQAQEMARTAELARAEQAIEQARKDGAKEAVEAAKAEWDAGLKDRLADADAEAARKLEKAQRDWRKTSDAALAEATAGREAAEAAAAGLQARIETLEKSEAALEKARGELATLKDRATVLEAERDRARGDAEQARRGTGETAEAALAAARAEWDATLRERLAGAAAEADRRLEQAEAAWRKESDAALADATSRFEKAEAALADLQAQARAEGSKGAKVSRVALDQARNELAVLKDRNNVLQEELDRAREAVEQARRDASGETTEAALAAARAEWDAALNRRLAEAEEDADRRIETAQKAWQVTADRDMAEATARFEKAEEAEKALRERVEALGNADTALQAARNELSVLKARNQALDDEMTERLAKASAEADRRLEKARAEWEESTAAELAAARIRCENAEATAEALRSQVEDIQAAPHDAPDDAPAAPAAADDRPGILARVAAAARRGGSAATWIFRRVLAPAGRVARRRRPRSMKLLLAAAAVAGIYIGVTYYPHYAPEVKKATAEAETTAAPIMQRIRAAAVPVWATLAGRIAEFRKPGPEIDQDVVTIAVDSAKVHEAPSATSRTIAAMPRLTDLLVIERRGDWVLAYINRADEPSRTGWIYKKLVEPAPGY